VLFISHDLGVVSAVAERVAVMYAGEIVEMGSGGGDFLFGPALIHARLISAIPTLKTDRSRPLAIVEKDAASGRRCGFAGNCSGTLGASIDLRSTSP